MKVIVETNNDSDESDDHIVDSFQVSPRKDTHVKSTFEETQIQMSM